jgi:hypothetical protein
MQIRNRPNKVFVNWLTTTDADTKKFILEKNFSRGRGVRKDNSAIISDLDSCIQPTNQIFFIF